MKQPYLFVEHHHFLIPQFSETILHLSFRFDATQEPATAHYQVPLPVHTHGFPIKSVRMVGMNAFLRKAGKPDF